jgi:hypothetical protein
MNMLMKISVWKKYVYSKSEYSTFFLLPIPADISKDGKEDYPPV